MTCTIKHCKYEIVLSNPHSAEATEVNRAVLGGTRVAGIDSKCLDMITACTGLPPVREQKIAEHNWDIAEKIGKVSEDFRQEQISVCMIFVECLATR